MALNIRHYFVLAAVAADSEFEDVQREEVVRILIRAGKQDACRECIRNSNHVGKVIHLECMLLFLDCLIFRASILSLIVECHKRLEKFIHDLFKLQSCMSFKITNYAF